MPNDRKPGDATLCTSAGGKQPHGAVTPPIFQSSTFEFETTEGVAAYARGESGSYLYTRYANPTWDSPERKLAALEHGGRAFIFSSGLAATAAWCLAHFRPGDRLVAARLLYGGTTRYLQEYLRPFGIVVDQVDFANLAVLDDALSGARGCWFESPANPTLRIVDGRAIADLCRKHRVLSAIDNTFATPINQKPIDWGIDWVMHSATKYLNGHSDLIGGALVAREGIDTDAVAAARIGTGGVMDPHAAFLLDRGMKTLALRVERHNANAMALAEHLKSHPQIARVHYPGLNDHPGHEIARSQMNGFGGVLAVDLGGGYPAAAAFVDRLRIITNAASLGGVESLVSLPILTSHVHATPEERIEAGVTDGTVRISVGIEDFSDLRDDVDQALGSL